MRRILVVAILVVVLLSWGMAFAFENEPEGFRGLKWGDPPTKNMQFLGEQFGNRRVYFRFNDKLEMGQAPLQAIIYFFYGESEKLFTGTLYFNKRNNYEELKTICKARFGEGTAEGTNSISWISSETMVHLIFWDGKGVGELHLVCGPLHQEFVEAGKKRQAEETEEEGYGEDIPPEVLEVIPDRVWKMIEEVKKKEEEPSRRRELINELKEGGVDVIRMTETSLLRSRLDYIMWNPHDFLCFYWEWDWIGLFHLNHKLPENIIGKTEGKLIIQVYDNRSVFVYMSEVALLEQFKKELVRIYHYAPRGFFSKMDRDIIALFYGYGRKPLGYFYQGKYHLWEK